MIGRSIWSCYLVHIQSSRHSRSQKSLKALTFNQELKQEVLSDMIFEALDFANKTFHLSLDNSKGYKQVRKND